MAEKKSPSCLLLPFEKLPIFERMTPEQVKNTLFAMAYYVRDGLEPVELEQVEYVAFEAMRPSMDKNVEDYIAKCENGKKGGRPKKADKSEQNPEKPKESTGFQEKPKKLNPNPNPNPTPPNGGGKAAAADSDLAQIVQRYQSEIGSFPRSALDGLQKWRETFPTETILLAIDRAEQAGKRNWRYVDGILKDWSGKGIRTVGDVAAADEQHEREKSGDCRDGVVIGIADSFR